MTISPPIPYTDKTKDAIIKEWVAKGYRLIEEQNYVTGQSLVFSDTLSVATKTETIETLSARVKVLEDKALVMEKI